MYILPQPQSMKITDSQFYLNYNSSIVIDPAFEPKIYNYAQILQKSIVKNLGFNLAIRKSQTQAKAIYLNLDSKLKAESYQLKIEKDKIIILAAAKEGLLFGVQTLRQIIKQYGAVLPCLEIEDYPELKNRGFYHDVSRGRIPKLAYLKKLAAKMSYYKLNQLQLYIEHSFLFEDFSEVWRDDTPLTAADIMDLDRYCNKLNIDLIPSLASFGHLYKVLSTKSYQHLAELKGAAKKEFSFLDRMQHHTIDASNPESLKFIKQMIAEFMPLFSSDYFNICADETFDLGQDRSQKLAAEIGSEKLYLNFVSELAEFVLANGKIPMFWGDIISKFPEKIKELPPEIICLNWGYAPQQSETAVKALAQAGAKQYLCPGVGGWNQILNLIKSSYQNITLMTDYAHQYQALGLLNTDWGDFGHFNHPEFSTMGLIYGANFAWNQKPLEFKEINQQISLLEYGDPSEKIGAIIAELSQQSKFGWEMIVRFQEMNKLKRADQRVTAYFADFEPDLVKKANQKIKKQVQKIYQSLSSVALDKKSKLQAYLIAAQAMLLFNKIALLINNLKSGNLKSELKSNFNSKQLAVDLEYFLKDYHQLWLSISRESEFYRIRDIINWYADYLRDLN
ncbi:glycoside hydrolase family 20 zincin-like fold domain-containing protein [Halanaerobium praevalens]|uniref:beta-N-acetylhexosaminidase n=1 Tax=Halanaerobium praevalens (strain ATCC 33744 / DSM 2228 / GSL) TaxID=572479 RepID=E3DS35_HALPG|nr:glycoside hydrolase family 20 zincin-like fold domain-containing protein [Halanaerobium praevalens]ADO78183.1 Glycoside hydrolase, family 20, catalytic core [Halanaerobium praevalens DSM 2228]